MKNEIWNIGEANNRRNAVNWNKSNIFKFSSVLFGDFANVSADQIKKRPESGSSAFQVVMFFSYATFVMNLRE